ncbi:alpha/beta fold hydrolase [Marinobacter sediminum]|uniref:alpha/beta fold hydrolase n=1 Tax=Marinobacter sediminum TaxID=256323 RepID=UPI0019398E84|nr:alpha/beta fold hydrolase [Marinobacter sediminum]
MRQRSTSATRQHRRRLITCIAALMLLLTVSACAPNSALYEPGPETLGAEPYGDFDQYRATVQGYLERNLIAVDGFSREQQIAWNLPFRTPVAHHCAGQPTTGMLLVHGLSDSPFVFRDLAQSLATQCVEVRTILLQGHGTRPGDMINAEADTWRQQVSTHFEALAQTVDHAFIGGFSLGGALATEYALSGQKPAPQGLVALAPAWQLNGLRNYLWLAGIADVFADFVEEEPELNPVKYESVTLNAAVQIGDVLRKTQQAIEQPASANLPLFLVATEADSVINLNYLTERFRMDFVHPASRMLIFRDTRQSWAHDWQDERLSFLNSYLPEANILEFSHQALAVAPNNELYGRGAVLQRCLEPNGLSLDDCRQLPESQLWFSAWHDHARSVPTSRLTYNPWYDQMVAAMATFIQGQTSP